MSEYINLGDVTYFGITITHPSGGMIVNADETPRYFLYKNASDTPLISANFVARANLLGTYRGSGDITVANGFSAGDYVEVHASGKVSGLVGRAIIKTFVVSDVFKVQVSGIDLSANNQIRDNIFNTILSDFNTNGTFGSGLNKISQNCYYAGIKFIKDSINIRDEYLVQWFRNSLPVSSGEVTNPAISVYKTSDGLALTQNNRLDITGVNNGVLRYNETSSLTGSGEPYLAITSGIIDGSLRVWSNPIGLDSL